MKDETMSQMDDAITEFLNAEGYRPIVAQELTRRMRITKKTLPEFRDALARLIADGTVKEGKKGRLRITGTEGLVTGVVRKITSGAAFVIPTVRSPELNGGDIYVSARDLRDAQTGDEVLVRLNSKRRSGGQRCGSIDQVVERASNVFVGNYYESGGQGFVRVDGTTFEQSIHVGDPGARGAVPDDKVVIEMLRFPSATRRGEAVLTKVLGQRGDPGIDTSTVIHILGIPHEFPDEALEDARTQAQNFDEESLGRRRDLTDELIVTIDPADARDFDDAISLTRTDKGHWLLGVHIADVAHFVTPGSPLDVEARQRGTSVYLPRHVIPMLPEVISNGLASLQQGVVRYTKSAFIEFSRDGSVLGTEIANTAIRVTRRFAYEEVMPIINKTAEPAPDVTPAVRQLLERMYKLAMLLRRRRFAHGALTMGIPEVAIDFDRDGAVTGAHERPHDQSHEIIEEFMLAANIAVARLLSSKDIPFLRRVHGTPDELRMRNFRDFCQGLGYELTNFQSRAEIQQVIHDAEGRPEQRAINFALLRSMKQAEYSPEEFGHFALAEEDYCHFTSPIRRYPDLTVHRLIGALADGRTPHIISEGDLVQLGRNCSFTERRAEKAERELIKLKLLRYMAERIGDEMDAFITGVENFGMFCQGVAIPAEGMIHISALTDDFYIFDQSTRTLTGQNHLHVYRLGDAVRVVVAAVDIDRRQLNLRIVPSTAARKTARVASGKQPDKSADRPPFRGSRTRDADSSRGPGKRTHAQDRSSAAPKGRGKKKPGKRRK